MSSQLREATSYDSKSPLLFGRFEVVMELGAGGSGRVLLCRDHENGELWALKELLRFGPDALMRFKSEFRTLSDVQHPNLVRLGELFESDARWAFTLEYVPGHDALSYVRAGADNENGFDEGRLRALLTGLVSGLQVIHSLGIVHRDVKPENVRVTPEGRVVLLDFGIATQMYGDRVTDAAPGTAAYVSPEQAVGKSPTPAADFYAVGVLLYEALTGRLPFEGGALEMLISKQNKLPPSPSTVTSGIPKSLELLCMALLSPVPERRPDGAAILHMLDAQHSDMRRIEGPLPRNDEAFVGRDHELSELIRQFDATEYDGARLVLVEGESGIGKSALVSRFAADVRTSGAEMLVLSGRCHSAEQLLYKAFDNAVDELSHYLKRIESERVAALLPRDAHLLPVLFPVLARVPAIAKASAAAPSALQSRTPLFRVFAELLRRVSEQIPILLTIDDLQWADVASLSLLETLLDLNRKGRLLVAATVRPIALLSDAVGARLAELVSHPRVARLLLGRLNALDSRRLVSRLLGASASAERTERLAHESGGHPLFVSELVRHTQENPRADTELDLDKAIVARVTQLAPDCLHVLTVSCFAAGPLPYTVLAHAVELPHESLRAALAELRARKLMRAARRDENIFYHDRIREAVVHSREPSLKARCHRALARAWEKEPEVEPVRVAYHFLQAGARDRAASWLEIAAERAKEALAFDRAAELYTLALSGIERASPHRQELYLKLGFALQHAGRREEAAIAFEGAAKRAQGATQQAMLLRASDQWLTGGFTARGLALLRKAGVRVPQNSLLTALLASYQFAALAFVRGLRVLSCSATEEERTARADTYWTLGCGLAFVEPLQAMFFTLKGARLSLTLGDSLRIARSLCGAGFAASALGLENLADRINALAAQAASHHATPLAEFYARAGIFLKSFLIDQDWASCIAQRAELDELWRQAGLGRSYEIDVTDLVATWALSNQGDLRALRRRYEELTALGRRGSNPLLDVALRVYHSILFLAADDPGGAEASLDDALTSWSPDGERFQLHHAWASFGRGEILLYRDVPERRGELSEDLSKLRSSLLDRIVWVRIRRDHVHARLALAEAAKAEGRARMEALREARRWLRRLASHNTRTSYAWARLVEAGILHLEGRPHEACVELERAETAFDALGMAMYETAARVRLEQQKAFLRGEERPAPTHPWLAHHGVVNPHAMLRMLAPGFP